MKEFKVVILFAACFSIMAENTISHVDPKNSVDVKSALKILKNDPEKSIHPETLRQISDGIKNGNVKVTLVKSDNATGVVISHKSASPDTLSVTATTSSDNPELWEDMYTTAINHAKTKNVSNVTTKINKNDHDYDKVRNFLTNKQVAFIDMPASEVRVSQTIKLED